MRERTIQLFFFRLASSCHCGWSLHCWGGRASNIPHLHTHTKTW